MKSGTTLCFRNQDTKQVLDLNPLGKLVLVTPLWSNVVNPISQTYQLGMIYDDTVFTCIYHLYFCDFGDDS